MKSDFQGGASAPTSHGDAQQKPARGDARPTKFSLLIFTAMILFIAASASAETTNTLSNAEIQGRQLAQQLYGERPTESLTNTGVLKCRDGKGNVTDLLIKFETFTTPTNWSSVYELFFSSNDIARAFVLKTLVVSHDTDGPTNYRLSFHQGGDPNEDWIKDNSDIIKTMPFAGDFGCADLGLEFFHWPQQKILPKTTNLKRGRAYMLLESTNPNPSTNGYSRVLSWIDKETGGILEAEAYDANGKLLKEFSPKSFKKVDGQWQLQEMEIRNVQTGSHTRLEFDLKK
jgi:hypothetical protein